MPFWNDHVKGILLATDGGFFLDQCLVVPAPRCRSDLLKLLLSSHSDAINCNPVSCKHRGASFLGWPTAFTTSHPSHPSHIVSLGEPAHTDYNMGGSTVHALGDEPQGSTHPASTPTPTQGSTHPASTSTLTQADRQRAFQSKNQNHRSAMWEGEPVHSQGDMPPGSHPDEFWNGVEPEGPQHGQWFDVPPPPDHSGSRGAGHHRQGPPARGGDGYTMAETTDWANNSDFSHNADYSHRIPQHRKDPRLLEPGYDGKSNEALDYLGGDPGIPQGPNSLEALDELGERDVAEAEHDLAQEELDAERAEREREAVGDSALGSPGAGKWGKPIVIEMPQDNQPWITRESALDGIDTSMYRPIRSFISHAETITDMLGDKLDKHTPKVAADPQDEQEGDFGDIPEEGANESSGGWTDFVFGSRG